MTSMRTYVEIQIAQKQQAWAYCQLTELSGRKAGKLTSRVYLHLVAVAYSNWALMLRCVTAAGVQR